MGNINDTINRAAEDYGLNRGGEWFKIQEGSNKIRVLSPGEPLAEHFLGQGKKGATCYGKDKGCPFHEKDSQAPGVKFLMWILDRKDEKIKLYRCPYTIFRNIGELQNSEEYAFEVMPMPYDITIKATGAGSKEVEYAIIPSPKQVPINSEQQEALDKLKTVEEVVSAMKEKSKKERMVNTDTKSEEIDPETGLPYVF